MAFKGDGFRDTLMLHAPQADHGIVPLMKLPPLRAPKTLGMAPAGTLMWAEGSLPFDDLLARIRTLVGTIDPDATEQMDGGLAQANQMLGVDVEKELLGGMSGPYGVLRGPAHHRRALSRGGGDLRGEGRRILRGHVRSVGAGHCRRRERAGRR